MIFDLTNPQSFKNLQPWLQEVERYASDDVVKLIIGNKFDKNDERSVAYEEAKVTNF